eukprot:gnl/Hemi2/26408_TR8863_c0_g1_i3.p2 gnl/Hemi2/26408_TR8863_c0_g1~~gnl/Hemi2/26408_TR8863_c0_g1_i3.p2  ORF type:complete len:550 (-),score=155.11 gnl/Hemi2/26408_TR8863_c0_g1_i3:83-1600(-)
MGDEENSNGKRGLSSGGDGPHKKARMDPMNPSRVLHVRGLPPDCYEQELLQAAAPFGRVAHVLLLRGKNQAFIEMGDLDHARQLVEYHAQVPAFIRGVHPIYYQYSSRTEITQSNNPTPPMNLGGLGAMGGGGGGSETANPILLTTILNVLYPITIETLMQIFSKYGAVLKMILFNSKSGAIQALIQFSEVQSAASAKLQLDGQNIYQNCCTLKIQYSKLTDLDVKYNNDRSRDFTNPYLPAGATDAAGTPSFPGGLGAGPLAGRSNRSAPGFDNAMNASGVLGGMGLPGMMAGMSLGGRAMGEQKNVLIIGNLNAERTTCDCLFTLFGVYGDVVRVKILFNKKDSALIQFANYDQANTALRHLNHCPLFGNQISVNFSNHTNINMPRPSESGEPVPGSDLTRDYNNSPLHRFKYPGSKNFKNICPPSPVLHISNVPTDVAEPQLRSLFSTYGEIVAFKFFENDRKMCLLQFPTLDESVQALIFLHNHRMGDSNLKVSFSKFLTV